MTELTAKERARKIALNYAGTPDLIAGIVVQIHEAEEAARREVVEEPKKQLQKCADWLMSAQGYLPWDSEIKEKLKGCEDETRILIKQLEGE